MSFKLPSLPYAYDAIEPHFDALTMEIHHSKHHAAYVTKLNDALEGTSLADKSLSDIISNLSQVPDSSRQAVRNNGGGHANHSLFWEILSPNARPLTEGVVFDNLVSEFGGFDQFKAKFTAAAMARFGSGWTWLCLKPDASLCICSTPNQDNPLMTAEVDCPGIPILGLDVWEHAYYLRYQNRRPDYIESFFNVINWSQVTENYTAAISKISVTH
jgi:Fe-Mn family superoxide dismutase